VTGERNIAKKEPRPDLSFFSPRIQDQGTELRNDFTLKGNSVMTSIQESFAAQAN
jgi:hypothetical protein